VKSIPLPGAGTDNAVKTREHRSTDWRYLYGGRGKGNARGTPEEAADVLPSRWSKFVKKNSWPVAPPSTTPIWSGYAPESQARGNTERPLQAADVTPRARLAEEAATGYQLPTMASDDSCAHPVR